LPDDRFQDVARDKILGEQDPEARAEWLKD